MGHKDPEKAKQWRREWELRNREKRRAQKRVTGKKWRANNPAKRMIHAARERAKKFGVPFSITEAHVVVPEVCPVLGIPLEVGAGQPGANSPSLDRIVPEQGYVPGNVVVISWRANRIKNDATPEELERVAAFYRQLCA